MSKIKRKYPTRNNNHMWKGHGEISGTAWCNIRNSSRKKNRELSITIEDAWELFLLQDRKCALSDDILYHSSKEGITSKYRNASLDRIDSTKGYIKNNVQWVHKHINKMKWELDQNYFVYLCHLTSKYRNAKFEFLEMPIPTVKTNVKNWKGCGCLNGKYWNRLKTQCNRYNRNIPLNITIEDAWQVYVKQNSRCAITGMPIFFNLIGECNYASGTASLDRINNKQGYEQHNIQWVHKDINRIKLDFDYSYLLDICDKISGKMPFVDLKMLAPSQNWFDSFKISDVHDAKRKGQRLGASGKNSTSKYKGVSFASSTNLWYAILTVNYKVVYHQSFGDEEQAAHHYDYYVLQHFNRGECFLNFPDYNYGDFNPEPKGRAKKYRKRKDNKPNATN